MKRRIAPRVRTSSRATLGPLRARPSASLQLRKLAVSTFLAVALVLLFAETGGQAAPGDAVNTLPYSKGFLVTGNYVVGGIDLNEESHPIVNGFSEGTIAMGDQIPANADVIAAYLFWETITVADDPLTTNVNESLQQASGVKFRGNDVDVADVWTVKRTFQPLTGSTAPCWSSGVPLVMNMFRADVLRFLPMQLDKDDYETGRFLVNDNDLVTQGFAPHTVTLPVRSGNQIPESAGASLFVAYRVPTDPLRKIVIYDGIYIKPDVSVDVEQTLQGFYLAASDPSARLTHVGGSGQPNNNDKILFNGTEVLSDPFNSSGTASQRGWVNRTVEISNSLMTPAHLPSGPYGQTATTVVKHQPPNGGYDCISWGAMIFSTAVADNDGDGLPDGLEDAVNGLKDPDGEDLPNLNAMGADSNQKDFFVEVNAMKADPGTSYGSADAPYDSTNDTVTDAEGHHHMPTPEDLKRVGDAYAAKGIRPHFDVGDVASYHALGSVTHSDWMDDYTSTVADQYLVGSDVPATNVASLARGGEIIKETGCAPLDLDNNPNPFCHFPDYPGTVIWKIGLQAHRDAMVDDLGVELTVALVNGEYKSIYYPDDDPDTPLVFFDWNATNHTQRRRFDPKRKGLFRYLLNAHARATPKSLPCLEDGHPAPYDVVDQNGVGSCLTGPNPDFNALEYHVPASASGIADLPGGDALVTLGLWDEFVGRPFARAGTTFHEFGHNLELWHGGLPATLGNKALNTATYIEPNCKPNHLSSMSYLFQVHGLFDVNDEIQLDYSGANHGAIDEGTTLLDGVLSPSPLYQPTWFAPAGSPLATMLGVSAATRFCSGEKFGGTPPAPMARVHAANPTAAIDWDGDLITAGPDSALTSQDVNFDGTENAAPTLLNGFDDWANLRLNQMGAVPIGALPGSLEGLDDAALIFWDGAGLLSGRGGLLSGRGGLLSGRGGLLSGRGGLLGGRGGVWHEGGLLGGRGGLLGGRGGLLSGRGGLLGGRGGEQSGEITHRLAGELGKTRPYALSLCIVGQDPDCSDADPFTPAFHRIGGTFNAPPFGPSTGYEYEVQRKRASASDATFVTIQTDVVLDTVKNKLTFIDNTELANAVDYAYRVRGLATDGNTGWSQTEVKTAVNDAPVAVADGTYQVNNKSTLTVPSQGNPGLLVNDTDHDSPSAYIGRRAVLVNGPAPGTGTLTCGTSGPSPAICADGSFRYVPPKGGSYVGLVTFTYKADDGDSNDGHSPQIPLSGYSNTVTVTINVFKK